ncbi:MAG: hypothetical protein P1P84_00585 [Deferrisomatales bacterium]|nr:hypothetical protein [Deferrisomatales bacterium]
MVIAALAVALSAAVVTPPRADTSSEGATTGVREFMEREGGPPAGVNRVDGVVSQVFADRHMIALIDVAEFRECQVVTCAKLTLPVQWQGELPALASTVRVTGSVEKQGSRNIFTASAVEVLEPSPGSDR